MWSKKQSRLGMLLNTPKRRRPSRRCPFVDDEAIEEDASESDHEVEEDSNVLGGTSLTSLPLIATTSSSQTTRRLAFMERGVDDTDTLDHHKHFGEKISIGLMNDVLAQFNVTHDTEPPLFHCVVWFLLMQSGLLLMMLHGSYHYLIEPLTCQPWVFSSSP